MIHFRLRYERLRAQMRSLRRRAGLLRAAWLALLLPMLGLILHMLAGTSFAPRLWLVGAGLAFALGVLVMNRRLSRRSLERELDRRFGLDELLLTAVEVDRRGARGGVELQLLDDAASTVAELGDTRSLAGSILRREAEMLAGMMLILAGLWLLMGTLAGMPELDRLPGLPAPGGELAGAEGEGQGPAGPGRASAAGAQLAGALGDHAAAREIASALALGKTADAARAARSLADRAGELSESGRQALAAALAEAAREMDALDPDLAEALRAAQMSLESEDPAERSAGIDRLASELDRMNEDRPLATALPIEAASRTGPPVEALTRAAQPLGLDASGELGAPRSAGRATLDGGADLGIEREAASPRTGPAGRLELGSLELGGDPQRVPWQMRETVRDYFAPEERAP